MSKSVVVTGMAIWSPFGRGLEAFWDGLASGRSGRSDVTRFDVTHPAYRTRAAAAITDIGPEMSGRAEEDSLRILRDVVDDVIADSGVDGSDVSPYDVAVCLGSSHSVTKSFLDYLRGQCNETVSLSPSGRYSWLSAGSVLSEVASRVDARGSALVVSTACASGTSSIGIAYDLIRQGRARRAFAGGVGYFSELSFSGFNILRLTGRDGCHPFDAERDGMMLGDGIALVVLEDEELARERGARINARIAGYASGNEAYHATAPDPEGAAAFRVMWNALNRSPNLLSRLDYINAHGTATLANDAAELVAVRRLLEMRESNRSVAISSTKGHHGHSLGAAGSVEFVATVLAMQRRVVPPSVGLENSEPGFEDLDLVRGAARPLPIRLALSNSFGFGGNAAAIAVECAETS